MKNQLNDDKRLLGNKGRRVGWGCVGAKGQAPMKQRKTLKVIQYHIAWSYTSFSSLTYSPKNFTLFFEFLERNSPQICRDESKHSKISTTTLTHQSSCFPSFFFKHNYDAQKNCFCLYIYFFVNFFLKYFFSRFFLIYYVNNIQKYSRFSTTSSSKTCLDSLGEVCKLTFLHFCS